MNNKNKTRKIKIGVVGAGSWGTAIANLLAIKGFPVNLWAYEKKVIKNIQLLSENVDFLPNIRLSKNIIPSNNLKTVSENKHLLIITTPSHVLRNITSKIHNFLSPDTILISASKGIENLTYLTMSGVIKSEIPSIDDRKLAVLTGPTFALEVGKQLPTLVSVATKKLELGVFIQNIFSTKYFRVYTIDDIIGAEIAASAKNVIAIASGVIDGLDLGLNTRAALITRGLAEITKLGLSVGGKLSTFSGLTGVGDLILTCTGKLSRNYSLGKKIGRGEHISKIIKNTGMAIEGLNTAKSIYNLSKKLNIEMPISKSVYKVIYENLNPIEAINKLMTRKLKSEF